MSMDVMMSAPVAGAPSPDTASTPSAPSAGAAGAFAALLDEAAGAVANAPSDPSDDDETADDIAAVVAASMMTMPPLTMPIAAHAIDLAIPAAQPAAGDSSPAVDRVSSSPDTASEAVSTTSLTAGAIASIAATKDDVAADATAAAPSAAPVSTPEASSNLPVPDDQTSIAPEAVALDVATTVRDVASEHDAPREASPRNTGAPPTAKATTAARHDPEARGSEQAASPRVADRPADPTVASPVAQAAVAAAEAPAPEARSTSATAARFARALERASAPITSEPQAADPTSGDAATTGQNSSQHDEQGRGQSAFVDRGTILTAAARLDSSPHGAIFTVPTAAGIELRGGAAIEGSSAAVETPLAQIPEREVVAQLVQSMRVQFRDGVGEAVVHLKPEHLGTVSISLRIENGAVSASIHAGVPEVRQWLESQQTQLRDGLADQGLRLERFVVEPDGKRQPADDQSDRGQARRRRPQPRRAADGAEQPIFEVLA